MRSSPEILAALLIALAPALRAFDSQAWLAVRGEHAAEAARLETAFAKCAAMAGDPAENIVVPVETHPDGSVKTAVSAKKARLLLKEGLLWGEGVKVVQTEPGGRVVAEVAADSCVVDRTTRSGWAKGHARAFYRDEAEIEGDGVYFSAAEEFIDIASNTFVRADGRLLRARRGDYDRRRGVVMLDGDVYVKGTEKKEEYELTAGKAFAFLEGTNSLSRIVALDGVKVVNGERRGECDRVVYQRRAGRITMYSAGAESPALLAEKGKRESAVRGTRITFWLDSDQVEIRDSEVTVKTDGFRLPGPNGGR